MSDSKESASTLLRGQTALVTGGGRGIGRAIAQALAAAGAKVAVLARSVDELAETVSMIQKDGGHACACTADVTHADDVNSAVRKTEESLGPIELLINNAGEVKPFGPLWETDAEEWWQSLEVNLRGPLLCTRAVLPGMIGRRRGRIVNVASGVAALSAPYYSSYIASKTALVRFTECIALEAKPHGVTLFAISPGTVRTVMASYSLESPEGKKWLPWFSKIFDQHIDVPPERAARLVLELASGKTDALSGRMFSIFDDLDLLLKNSAEIEYQNLYSLKMDKLPAAGGNPALAAVLAAAQRAAETKKE
jgi:NAD(P)-dependent dehydrogenase (short-subunit alcohol dehydrogenase family)